MKKDARSIYHYEIEVLVKSSLGLKGVTPPPIHEVIQQIDRQYSNSKAKVRLKSDSELIFIADTDKRDKDTTTLLINISDKNTPDVVYADHNSGERISHRKTKTQGQEYSAHVVIEHNPVEKFGNKYRMLVEQVPGLSGRYIVKFLSRLLKDSSEEFDSEYYKPHPDGSTDKKGRQREFKFWYSLRVFGIMSEEFRKQLIDGYLTDIQLVSDEVKLIFDENACAKAHSRIVKLKTEKERKLGDWLRLSSVLKTANQNDYETAKISFTTDEGTDLSISIDTATEDIKEGEKYIKRTTITDFQSALETSTPKIDQERRNKMLELLTK